MQVNSSEGIRSKNHWRRRTLIVLALGACVIALIVYLQFRLSLEERQFVGTWVLQQTNNPPVQVDVRSDRVMVLTYEDRSTAKYQWEVAGTKLMITQKLPASLQRLKTQIRSAILATPTLQRTEVFQWEKTDDGFTLREVSGSNSVSPSVIRLCPIAQ